MVNLSGKDIQFFLASGMMGFNGRGPTIAHQIMYYCLEKAKLFDPSLFAIVTKTISYSSIVGPKEIRPKKDGWWNNYGMDNPGINRFLLDHRKKIEKRAGNIIVSVAEKDRDRLKIIISSLLVSFPDLLGIERNVSCPNIKNGERVGIKEIIKGCEQIKNSFDINLILKVGGINYIERIAKETEGLVDAISINSVACFPTGEAGAISGKMAQPKNWEILEKLVKNTSTPVIAPSIWEYEDIEKVIGMGAKAISFGTVSLPHPRRPWGPILPTQWAKKHLKKEIKKGGY